MILTYYFDARLARANGVSSTGVAVATFALPPFLQLLIEYYGWRGTLLILAGLVANMGACGALYRPTEMEYCSKLRNSHSSRSINGVSRQSSISKEKIVSPLTNQTFLIEGTNQYGKEKIGVESCKDEEHGQDASMSSHGSCAAVMHTLLGAFDVTLFQNFYFTLLVISYFPQGLGYIIATHYLPIKAVHAGISELNAAYLISAIGISSGVARITHGYIIDYNILSALSLTALSPFVCGLACALNPITDNYGVLVTNSVIVGLSSGVYNSTNALLAKEYIGMQQITWGVGFTFLAIGCGSVLGAYLTGM